MENSVLNVMVSRYNNYAGIASNCNLLEYLNDYTYMDKVLEIRSKATKNERDLLKSRLPGITPSAICFPSRSINNVVKHTGLINFDIDKIPNDRMDEIFNTIKQMPFVAYCGLSVSGTGYWGIVPISNTTKHDQHFEALQLYFKASHIDLPYFDIAVKDISRFRFYSVDLNAYFNHNAQLFTYIFEAPSRAVNPYHHSNKITSDENPFTDFNINGDIETLLLNHGWTFQPAYSKVTRKRYSRPGKNVGISADYCTEKKILYLFSSDPSTELPQSAKGYNNVTVFCHLECGNDWKLCGKRLLTMGYGTK